MKASEAGKLKVAELQKLLKERGLPSSGTKAELVQRLVEASEKNPANDEANKNSEPSAAPAKSTAAESGVAKEKVAEPSTKTEDSESKAAATAPAAAATTPTAPEANAHGTSKPVSLDLDENERRKARAAKFGLPSEELNNDKLKARAAKFGLPLASVNSLI
ncbi:hypothetical protein GUITHDRAFT_147822 [Guillardia theta CCMP2712]|uniref:SAP domain-containing protein n=1 Tax=Guillardia theta (strain CCMP2712) TaxID=905079 RepID=L1IBB1_GUITC|nr:hypothetical protein GUITHDRAFT_147822 [Guillardia theta CCMP2712]EKX33551.1 hypothetical protein GUITHDRAFT_147822 [Guillardia theta CCMP2712]|eukprot:XP_005820531.1 hypothetical protein GUITHDRAFT_147822 [Guillardia theta CCMP2712]